MTTLIRCLIILLGLVPSTALASPQPDHGPRSNGGFSHQFQLEAHQPQTPQLSFHYGLLQPLLLGGFNAAVDVRYKRLVLTYSHGQGLDFSDFTSQAESEVGLRAEVPWSTGFGLGAVLIDELYILADAKLHAFDVRLGADTESYKTATLGIEVGYRLFLYKGLHIAPVIRYWPTVWSSIPKDGRAVAGNSLVHRPMQMGADGFFVNLLIGWAFEP